MSAPPFPLVVAALAGRVNRNQQNAIEDLPEENGVLAKVDIEVRQEAACWTGP